MPKHHIKLLRFGVRPHPHRFVRRILPVIIEIHDVRALRLPPAAQHRIVLTEVPRVLHVDDRHLRLFEQLTAHRRRRITAAVVHQYDLMAALDH